MTAQTPEGTLEAFSHGEHPIFAQLAQMNMDTLPNSELDRRTYHIARLAALIAMDAAPASYFANLAVAREAGLTVQDAQGVCVAIAPIVGSARVVDAAGNVLRAFGLAELAAEYVAENDAGQAGARTDTETGSGVAAGAAAGATASGATGVPGQRQDATAEQRMDQTVEGRRPDRGGPETGGPETGGPETGGPETGGLDRGEEPVSGERFVDDTGAAGAGAAAGKEATAERTVGEPERRAQDDVPSGGAPSDAVTTEAQGQRAEEGTRSGQEGTAGTGERIQGAKDKLEEESREETGDEGLAGKVRDWMKRDQ